MDIKNMNISDLIEYLEKMKAEHGDIKCAVSESHEYWGTVETYITEYNLNVSENAQPDGPKKPGEKCVLFSYN